MQLSAGQFNGSSIADVPLWYLSKLIGDTTEDGLAWADLNTSDQISVRIESLARSHEVLDTETARRMLASIFRFAEAGGYTAAFGTLSEEVDLTGEDENAATPTTADLLPISNLVAVLCECTVSIAGDATAFGLGDDTTATRFLSASDRIVAGDSAVRYMDWTESGELGDAAQAAASVVNIQLNDAATAGKLKITTFFVQFATA